MAMQIHCRFDRCALDVAAWDDGNPYDLDDRGEKRYADDPAHDLVASCIGNDSPHPCLACAETFMQDSRASCDQSPHCASAQIVDLMLEGCRCPWFRFGVFRRRTGIMAIS